MGELFIKKEDSPWDLKMVGNEGEIPADRVGDDIVVEKQKLLTDIKAQLMMVPNTLTYTVGWRALVWHNEKTGAFQALTDDEFKSYLDGGIVTYTRGTTQGDEQDESSRGDAGSNTL